MLTLSLLDLRARADAYSTIGIGDNARVASNVSITGGIAIGKDAYVLNGGGLQESQFTFDNSNWRYDSKESYSGSRYKVIDQARVSAGIAIGTNAHARTGALHIGSNTYFGKMGGIDVTPALNKEANIMNMTTVGSNSYNKGMFSTMFGIYNIATGDFDGGGMSNYSYGAQNLGATTIGSFNSIRTKGSSYSGTANSIVGLANITEKANGALIFGAGNKISNSIINISGLNINGASSVDAMADSMRSTIKSSKGGGAVLAIGGGNTADYVRATSIIGVNNDVLGNSKEISEYNFISGFKNSAEIVDNVTLAGINNTVKNSSKVVTFGNENAISDTEGTVVLGDNRTVVDADNSIILGVANKAANSTLRAVATTTLTTTAKNVLVMGYNANAEKDNSVALGANSVASIDKGKFGYDPTSTVDDKLSNTDSATWKSTLGSVSVGVLGDDGIATQSRQITGVAAGTNDTDAVNVAQLKAVEKIASDAGSAASNVKLKFIGDESTETPIEKGNGETLTIYGGATEVVDENNIGVLKTNKGLRVQLAKELTGLTSINVGGTKGDNGSYTGGITINAGGINMGGNKITNVGSGVIKDGDNSSNTNVANISDVVYLVGEKVEATKVTAGDNIKVENNKVSLKDDITLGKETTKQVNIKGSEGTITAGSGANQVAIDGKAASVIAGEGVNQVTLDGSTGKVVVGSGTGAVTVSNQYITGLDNTTWDPGDDGKNVVKNRAATEGQLQSLDQKISNIDTAVKESSRVFAGDEGQDQTVTVKSGDTLNLNGGADVKNLSNGNIGVVVQRDKDGNITNGLDIKLSKDLTGLNSVTTGNTTINNHGLTIKGKDGKDGAVITNDGLTIKDENGKDKVIIKGDTINMGGNTIHNIGKSQSAGDAINKGELEERLGDVVTTVNNGMGQMSNRISKLDRRVDRVGAGAAALAALHPLEFSPEAKWEVSAGVGNYKGANAVALGAFYRPNGDTMFSIGTSLGGGENMVNAGVTLRVGEGETENYPARKVMAQEITTLKGVVAEQNAKLEAQNAQLEEQNQKIEQLLQAVAALQK